MDVDRRRRTICLLHVDCRLVQAFFITTLDMRPMRPDLRTDYVLVGHWVSHHCRDGLNSELVERQPIATAEGRVRVGGHGLRSAATVDVQDE